MKIVFAAGAAILIGCTAARAQSGPINTPLVPAMGATSPLGIPGASPSNPGTGIPLGATEINPGGLSPLSGSICNGSALSNSGFAGGGTVGMTSTSATNSIFDGGGLASACQVNGGTATSGNALPSSTPGATANSSSLNNAIPLGATEINSGGISPIIPVPAPDTSTFCSDSSVSAFAPLGSASADINTGLNPSGC